MSRMPSIRNGAPKVRRIGVIQKKAQKFNLVYEYGSENRPVITMADDVQKEMRDILSQRKEFLVAFFLDTRKKIIAREIIHIGSVDTTTIHPREIFRAAILHSASSMIVSHNHPSGDPSPSQEDLEITRRLIESGKMLGIPLLDHVIVTKQGFYDMRKKEPNFDWGN